MKIISLDIFKKNQTKEIQPLDYSYIIKLIQSAKFCDISTPLLTPIELSAGVYEIICVPSRDNVETFWWSINGRDIGIAPLELKKLMENNQAKWLKKPASHIS